MNKEDWIWVAIRIFGIFLIVMAILALPRLISSAHIAWVYRGQWTLCDDISESSEAITDLMKKAYAQTLADLISNGFRVVCFTLIGIYFLRGGSLIFRLINPPESKGEV